MKAVTAIALVLCTILGPCTNRVEHELLGEADSRFWILDSVQGGSKYGEFINFHRSGKFENYYLGPDDSLYAVDYGDVIHCMTYDIVDDDSIVFDCDCYHIDSIANGRMTLRDPLVGLFYFSVAPEYPIAKLDFAVERFHVIREPDSLR